MLDLQLSCMDLLAFVIFFKKFCQYFICNNNDSQIKDACLVSDHCSCYALGQRTNMEPLLTN